jgi:hypothetical protein
MTSTPAIIYECKAFIDAGDVHEFKLSITNLMETIYPSNNTPDWAYIFQKVYLHSCLRGRTEMALWLAANVYPQMDGIQQIALRHVFPYGRYLLAKYESSMRKKVMG